MCKQGYFKSRTRQFWTLFPEKWYITIYLIASTYIIKTLGICYFIIIIISLFQDLLKENEGLCFPRKIFLGRKISSKWIILIKWDVVQYQYKDVKTQLYFQSNMQCIQSPAQIISSSCQCVHSQQLSIWLWDQSICSQYTHDLCRGRVIIVMISINVIFVFACMALEILGQFDFSFETPIGADVEVY